jgi:membrane-associated HD superfamily phosphohydrolase
MQEKIERNIELADVNTGSRFGSAKADIPYIIKSPLIGYGKNIENIYGKSEFNLTLMHRNNGLTKLIVNYGFIIFIIYMLRVYKSMIYLCKLNNQRKLLGLFLFISIIELGFSQSIFNYPVFYLFLFLPKFLELEYRKTLSKIYFFNPGYIRAGILLGR